MRDRLINAAVALLLGIAFCFFMYWWQFRYEYATHGVGVPLFAAIPFVGLAVLVLGGLRRLATAVGFIVLAGLTGIAFTASATSSSSTAALVWILPLLYGAPLLIVLIVADTFLRSWKGWRRG